MSWINRSIARTGSAALLFALLIASAARPAFADSPLVATYEGHAIRFTHLASVSGQVAIGVEDPGFAELLRDTGAVMTWKPGERYVLISTAAPLVVSFAIGDARYDVGPIALTAGFAPFLRGDEPYLPFKEVLRGLDLALREDAGAGVFVPQISSVDVREDGSRVTLLLHGGAPLRARVVEQSPSTMTYAFDGVGTTVAGMRQAGSGVVHSVAVANSGSVRQPVTLVTVNLAAGAVASAPQNVDGRDVQLTFDTAAGAAASASAMAGASPTPEPVPASSSSAAVVTAVTLSPSGDGAVVTVAVSGSASFEWHRLRQPDNRFWVDFKNAQLQSGAVDQNGSGPLLSMRVRQLDADTVRVALTLDGPKSILLAPSDSGLGITIGSDDVADAARSGSGGVGSAPAGEQIGTTVTPAPPDGSAWKFGPRSSGGYVPTNPRLIVIDPGHGGSDPGTQHGGLSEAELTLDMAKRLSAILIARGWEVKLTHDTNVDVYQPNDSAHDELQARDDIANNAGARMFVSIHVNAFLNSGPYGTTLYISKPEDVPLGHAIETHTSDDGTKDDGVIKARYYVTLHARMPAVLIETAFVTNPSDYALLGSSQWRQKIAGEIADGITDYAQAYPVPNQPDQ